MWRVVIMIIVALAITMPAQAKSKKPKKHDSSQKVTEVKVEVERIEAFSPAERNLIRARMLGKNNTASQQSNKSLPPGLQKKVARGKSLPPGWQKKLAPGQSLDYQVYRQGESLPDMLLQRLPPSSVGSEILQVENKIIRLNSATRTILDVFDLTPAR